MVLLVFQFSIPFSTKYDPGYFCLVPEKVFLYDLDTILMLKFGIVLGFCLGEEGN